MSKTLNGKRSSQAGKLRGIYQRGNIFWFSRMLDGRRTQVSLGTTDYGEAVVKALEVLENPFLIESAPLDREIHAFLEHKERQNEYSPASRKSKQYALSEFASFLKKRDVSAITPADVERFYRQLQARVSESTAQGYVTTIRSFFNRQVEMKRIRANPVAPVRLARCDQKSRLLFCSPEQRNQLIANAPNDEMRLILYAGFHAGLRKNEIIQMRPSWIDLERGSLHVRATESFRPKDREARTIPLTSEFRQFLLHYGLRSPFMLKPKIEQGVAIYRYDFRRPFGEYVKSQGMPWCSPHVLRHSFASLLASKGVSIYKIAIWLGDDVRVAQKHYAKLSPKDDDIEKAFTAPL